MTPALSTNENSNILGKKKRGRVGTDLEKY